MWGYTCGFFKVDKAVCNELLNAFNQVTISSVLIVYYLSLVMYILDGFIIKSRFDNSLRKIILFQLSMGLIFLFVPVFLIALNITTAVIVWAVWIISYVSWLIPPWRII